MSHKMLRPFIVKVSVLGYFPLLVYRQSIHRFNLSLDYDTTSFYCYQYNYIIITYKQPIITNVYIYVYIIEIMQR